MKLTIFRKLENPMLMAGDILERIVADTLRIYLGYDDRTIEVLLDNPNYADKKRVETIEHLEVLIHSNDHLPPHFHVQSNDLRINAKFSIETGEYLSGSIRPKDIKKIKAFYQSSKGKIVLQTVWKKFHG